MVAERSSTEPSEECILTIHVKIEYGERKKLMTLSYKQLSKQNSDLDNELRDVYLDNLELTHANELLKDEVIKAYELLDLERVKNKRRRLN